MLHFETKTKRGETMEFYLTIALLVETILFAITVKYYRRKIEVMKVEKVIKYERQREADEYYHKEFR